ncbi:MAG TPA: glycosyltransferase family 4 protein [Thermoanaerobaculia bacterium]|nr:glycosyltransferase family 4 protein [Thermoanaerobaculia bacterium]
MHADSMDAQQRSLAIVDWTQLVEDYLDNIEVSFEAFCNETTGGWLFGYIDALQAAGVRAMLMCVSARVTQTERFTHKATGATICVLPAPRLYRMFRRRVLNPYEQWSRLAPYLATPVVALARELRRQRCGAILCQDYEHGRFDVCVLLAKLMRLPVFATFQGGDTPGPFPRALALRACDGLIVATRAEAARVTARYRLPASKLARVFNPLCTGEWRAGDRSAARAALAIPDDARVVAWHGRADYHRKGLDVLFDAWDRICRDDRRLLLIGAGNESAALRERVARSRGVIWIDEYLNDRDAIRRHLSAADVYAFPSRHEGFPVAPLEAMALQLPVVASDAVPDLLDEDSGVLVPCGDAAALANALDRLLDDQHLARILGERARRRIEMHFSPAAVGAQLRSFMRLA